MPAWLVPRRRRGVEILDGSDVPAEVRVRAVADVARANRWLGGTRAIVSGFRTLWPAAGSELVVLDVGTGAADIPARLRRDAAAARCRLVVIGLDASPELLRAARAGLDAAVAGDALRLPVRNGAADVVLCSQLLHHFRDDDAARVVAELHRASRGWVVIGDLHRSWVAAAGFWLVSRLLAFHPVTRHDGIVSVLRGFTPGELAGLVTRATAVVPAVTSRAPWRLTAVWRGASA